MNAVENNSEVARLLAQINQEYEAARTGLTGLAQGSSQHQFMTARTERIAGLYLQLHGLVGDEAARKIDLGDDQGGQEELTVIAMQLRETASYAVDPRFKGQLRVTCLEHYREMARC